MANQVATPLQSINFSIRYSLLSPFINYKLQYCYCVCLFVRVVLTTQSSVLFHRLSNNRRCNSEQLGENEHEILEFPLNHHRNSVIFTPQKFCWVPNRFGELQIVQCPLPTMVATAWQNILVPRRDIHRGYLFV